MESPLAPADGSLLHVLRQGFSPRAERGPDDAGGDRLAGGRDPEEVTVAPMISRAGNRGQTTVFEKPWSVPGYSARLRRDSNRHTPLATETFRLSTLPRIGMRSRRSQRSRVSRRMPSPSAPSTHAIAAGSSDS